MANAETTDATAPEGTQVTETQDEGTNPETTEEATPSAESPSQDFTAKIAEFEEKLKERDRYKELAEQRERELKLEQGKSARLDSQYRGLQRQATQKLQQAADLQRQVQSIAQNRQEMAEMREVLSFIASQVVQDDNAVRELQLRQKEAALKAQEEWARNPQVAADFTIQETNTIDDQKRTIFASYFANVTDVDPLDPNLDWGNGETDQIRAMRRLEASIERIRTQGTTAAPPQVDQQTNYRDELAAMRAEMEANQKAAVEEAKAAAAKEAEKKLRSVGVDDGAPDGVRSGQPTKSSKTRLNEVNESLLYEGEPGVHRQANQKKYLEMLEAEGRRLKGLSK